MKLIPHLTFDGQCEFAFKFYERCLGGKVTMMLTWGQSPMAEQVPQAWREKILHATLTIGDGVLTGADLVSDQYEKPRGFKVLLNLDEPLEAERIFRALAENGAVEMPIQQTFWSLRYGVLVDRFSIPWEINCGSPAEGSEAVGEGLKDG